MQIKEIREMVRLVSQSGLSVFEMENDGFRIRMENNTGTAAVVETTPAPVAQMLETDSFERVAQSVAEQVRPVSGTPVKAPLVGVFYASPSPDQESYVKVGDVVKKGDILCIIEAMKVMNEITAEKDGVITAVLAENEALVEYGQDLFMIG